MSQQKTEPVTVYSDTGKTACFEGVRENVARLVEGG
jgi:hypothetical protein